MQWRERVCVRRTERNHAFKRFREMFLGTWSSLAPVALILHNNPSETWEPSATTETSWYSQITHTLRKTNMKPFICSAAFVHISVSAGLMCDACKTGFGCHWIYALFPQCWMSLFCGLSKLCFKYVVKQKWRYHLLGAMHHFKINIQLQQVEQVVLTCISAICSAKP